MKTNKQLFRLLVAIFFFCFLFIGVIGYHYLQIVDSRKSIATTHEEIRKVSNLNAEINYFESSLLQIHGNQVNQNRKLAVYHLNHTEELLVNLIYSGHWDRESKEGLMDIRNWIIQNRMSLLRLIHSSGSDMMTLNMFLKSERGVKQMQNFGETLQNIIEEKSKVLSASVHHISNTIFYLILFAGITCIVGFLLFYILIQRLDKDMFRRRQVEQQLVINEQRFNRIVNNADISLYTVDLKGVCSFVSSQATQLTGYTEEELLNRSFLNLIEPEWKDRVFDFYVNQLSESKVHTLLKFPIVTKSGNVKWVEQSCILVQESNQVTGFQCTVKDITDSVLLEEAVSDQFFKLQSILDYSPSIVFIKDLEGRYLMVNRKYNEMFDLSNEKVIGKTDFDLADERLAKRYQAIDEKVIANKEVIEFEDVIKFKSGLSTHIVVKFPLYDKANKLYGVGCISTDITEIAEYRRKLRKNMVKAENSEKMQELFLASMSHEIRTPMNAILGLLREVKKTHLSEDQQKLVNTMHKSTDHLMVIINDILDVSKIQAGKLHIERTEFNVRELMQNCMQIISSRVKEQVKLLVTVDDNVASVLKGDPYRIKQIALNLLSNAAKFTESGTIKLNCQLAGSTIGKQNLRITVSDTGIGMDPQYTNKIFDKFSQEEKSTTRKYGGTGLGMFITKNLIDLMDGHIEVKSMKGVGSEFIVNLPLEVGAVSFTTSQEQSVVFDSGTLKNVRILLVDDNEVNRLVASTCLKYYGPVIDEVTNGVEAVEAFSQKEYDVILMDIQMPEMDGYQAADLIRNKFKSNIPVIALTASALSGENNRCIELGMNDYISKPFEESELVKKIQLWTQMDRRAVV
jgi:PAS domain S-box-containing protein